MFWGRTKSVWGRTKSCSGRENVKQKAQYIPGLQKRILNCIEIACFFFFSVLSRSLTRSFTHPFTLSLPCHFNPILHPSLHSFITPVRSASSLRLLTCRPSRVLILSACPSIQPFLYPSLPHLHPTICSLSPLIPPSDSSSFHLTPHPSIRLLLLPSDSSFLHPTPPPSI